MKAKIEWAHIKALAQLNDTKAIGPIEVLNKKEAGDEFFELELKAPVLVYEQDLLEQNGYVAVDFLNSLEKTEKIFYSVYGPFIDYKSKRCHFIAPVDEAMKVNLRIYDWSILQWQTN